MPKIFFEKLAPDINNVSYPPSPAVLSRPVWWKNMDKFNYEKQSRLPKNFPHSDCATIRSCPAIADAINFGYTLYTQTDIFIDATDDENINWNIPETSFSNQDSSLFFNYVTQQDYLNFKIPEGYHKIILKMNSLYGIKTDPGYSCWITTPMHRNDLPFKIIDAVVDTDTYPSRFPYSFFIKKGFYGIIKSGTPFLHIVPFKREEFSSEIIDVTMEEVNSQISLTRIIFSSAYKKMFWTRKKFN